MTELLYRVMKPANSDLEQTICGMWGKEGGGGGGGRSMVTINESIYCAKTASMFQNVAVVSCKYAMRTYVKQGVMGI